MIKRAIPTDASLVEQIFSAGASFKYDHSPQPGRAIRWHQQTARAGKPHTYYYIHNADGSIRWIFPADARYPAHLSLYNSSSWKARVYRAVTRLAFATGLKKLLISGSFELSPEQERPLRQILEQIPHDTFAIFTGTTGENRKSVVAVNQGMRSTHFIKIAHTPRALSLIRHEAYALEVLGQKRFRYLRHSEITHATHGKSTLVMSNVTGGRRVRQSALLRKAHLQALAELYQAFWHKRQIQDIPFFAQTGKNLRHLTIAKVQDPRLDQRQVHRITAALWQLYEEINPQEWLDVSFTHSDFTPWNMYHTSRQLYVYDWELAQDSLPLLYDLFHFVYQSGILLQRLPYDRIRHQLEQALQAPQMQEVISTYKVDVDYLHRLYLLHLVSYYLRIYVDEPSVHVQVQWLLDTWEQALKQWQDAGDR